MTNTLITEHRIVLSRRRFGGLIAGAALAASVLTGAVIGANSSPAVHATTQADDLEARVAANSKIADFPPYLIAQAQQQLLDAASAELGQALGRTTPNFQP